MPTRIGFATKIKPTVVGHLALLTPTCMNGRALLQMVAKFEAIQAKFFFSRWLTFAYGAKS